MSEYIMDTQYDIKHSTVKREQIVRCRDCQYSKQDGTICMYFASWEPIAGGDEYEDMPVRVSPDGFCAWGELREGSDK